MAAPTTIDPDTELSAVNTILGAIGQSPVTTLGIVSTVNNISTYQNPEISFVWNLLKECNAAVQNEGWHFNKEEHVIQQPDPVTGFITIPNNILRMDYTSGLHGATGLADKTHDVVRRNGRLYDKVNHTDVFTEDIYTNVVWFFEYEDVPSVFKRYITYKAAGRAATQLVTNQGLVGILKVQEDSARATCMEYECNQGDHSFFGHPHETQYTSFQPFHALRR